jgi:arsenical-resistance protein 2
MASEPAPWHAAYPNPRSTPETISRSEVLERLKRGELPGRDILLVDLRRNDHEVRRIPASGTRLIFMAGSGLLTCLPSSYRVVPSVAR